MLVYTLGHSTRSADEIARITASLDSKTLVDVRRWPTSKRNPGARREALEEALARAGVNYIHIPALGGYRAFGRDAPENLKEKFNCYKSQGFNAYAAYLATNPQAWRGLELIAELADSGAKPVVMCSERLPWKCHRKIIAEWLAHRGYRVVHVIEPDRRVEHRPGKCPQLAPLPGQALHRRGPPKP